MVKPFTQKYRPTSLSQIKGQDTIIKYFSAAVNNPERAVRSYVLTGAFGSGKTSLARAFASELLQIPYDELTESPSYLELDPTQLCDSFDSDSTVKFNSIKDYIFNPIPGYKVVTLDELHLVSKKVQGAMLKPIEESSDIFFFFVSTERDGIEDTIYSRSLEFTFEKFSDENLYQLLVDTLCYEGVGTVHVDTLRKIIKRSRGHARDALNQLQFYLMVGEQAFLESYHDTDSLFARYFSKDKSAIDELLKIPYLYVELDIETYILNNIIRDRKHFSSGQVAAVFSFYIKIKRYIQTENDFYSFLFIFLEFFTAL